MANVVTQLGEARTAETEELQPEEVIENYLDHLCAPLVGVVPYPERNRLRAEAGYHLDCLMSGYIVEGMEPRQAARTAVERYGSSHEVGQQFLESWFEHQPRGPVARRIGLGNVRAMTFFGIGTLLVTGILQARIYWPAPEPLTFGLTLADVRRIVPEPLPLPDAHPTTVALLVLSVLAPIIAGILTGRAVPVRPGRAVYQVQSLLTLYTFVLGVQMLPLRDGVFLGLFMLVFWIPVGCLTAQVAALWVWRRRCWCG